MAELYLNIRDDAYSSGGDLSPVDDLKNTKNSIMYANKNVFNTSLKEYRQSSVFSLINEALLTPPEEYNDCCWKNVCRGGNLVHRYSKKNDFKNKSIYCKALIKIYGKVSSELLQNPPVSGKLSPLNKANLRGGNGALYEKSYKIFRSYKVECID